MTGPRTPPAPRWEIGQVVRVEISLVATDATDLACAVTEEIAGRYCAFDANGRPWSAGKTADAEKILRPYTTSNETGRVQFLAAGLWTDPALQNSQLPATRFNVSCSYRIEGRAEKPIVRWAQGAPWFPRPAWPTGVLSGCAIVP